MKEFGVIDILSNCAGTWTSPQALVDCSEEDWDKVIDVNLKGVFPCCNAVGKAMIRQKKGNIINFSSRLGINPAPSVAAYSTAKAGIIMLTRQLALELAPYYVRVNALARCFIKTDFNIHLWKDPIIAKQIAETIPLGRLAEPEEVANSALFLASEESSI